jgi:hypothetical protein
MRCRYMSLKKETAITKSLLFGFILRERRNYLDEPLLPKILDAGYSVISADLPGTGNFMIRNSAETV